MSDSRLRKSVATARGADGLVNDSEIGIPVLQREIVPNRRTPHCSKQHTNEKSLLRVQTES
jgi:hypothetical protein